MKAVVGKFGPQVAFGIGEEGIEVYPRCIDALGVRGQNSVDVANHLFFAEYTLITSETVVDGQQRLQVHFRGRAFGMYALDESQHGLGY